MRKIGLIFLCFPFFVISQTTAIVDTNFELALINLGFDNVVDGFVLTSRIDTIDTLIVSNRNIEDLTGIEDFTALSILDCSANNLNTIDITANYFTFLDCSDNNLQDIDISNHLALRTFKCNYNEFSQLDVSSNTSLLYFECYENQLTSLDISSNVFLTELMCNNNYLTSLDVAGIDMYVLVCDNNQLTTIDNLSDNISLKHLSCSNNNIFSLLLSTHLQLNWISCSNNQLFQLDISNQGVLNYLFCWGNPSLNCINVSNVVAANTSWSVWDGQSGNIDAHHYFSANCIMSSTDELKELKKLITVINLNGQETQPINNTPLLYRYDDGTVEQKIVIE